MALSPLGNINFVNQNVSLTSTQVSNEVAKESFASLANLAEFAAKEKVVDKLEKVAKSNPLEEDIKEKAEEEKKRQKKGSQDEETEEENEEIEAQILNNDEIENDEAEEIDENNKFKNSHTLHRLDISI